MLIKHAIIYLFSRGVPGLISFLAIPIYSRLLSPDEFGRYALIIATVAVLNVTCFQWIRLSLLRFLPEDSKNHKNLLGSLLSAFIFVVIITGIIGMTFVFFWNNASWKWLLYLSIPLLWVQAWFELNLELLRSRLQPVLYGCATSLKAVLAIIIGTLLTMYGFGEFGPVLGLLIGLFSVGMFLTINGWGEIRIIIDHNVLLKILRYGMPLTATAALSFIIGFSDRFLIAYFLGEGAVGAYSVSYDLVQQTLTLLMMIVNLAAYPLAVRALETEGITAAEDQCARNGRLLIVAAVPASVGICLLGPQGANIIIGADFREPAGALIPLIAPAALLSGLRAYHYDLAFQLGKYTIGQLWVFGIAASINVILNFILIPRFQLVGAAWATLVSYGLALILSMELGKKIFRISFYMRDIIPVVFGTLIMVLAISGFHHNNKSYEFFIKVGIGAVVFGSVYLILNLIILRYFNNRFSNKV